MLAVFLLFGHWMEMHARRGTTDALRTLLDLAPQTATVERDGQQVERSSRRGAGRRYRRAQAGRQGARSTARCIDGASSIDESMVTGESVPVEKGPGDPVIAGSINRVRHASLPRHQGRRRHRAGADRAAGPDGAELARRPASGWPTAPRTT